MCMFTDEELIQYLPSHQRERLSQAIGQRLIEVERLFGLDLARFLEDKTYSPEHFFSYNSGPAQFHFEDGLIHVLDVWGEQLSIVITPDPLQCDQDYPLYRLSQDESAPLELKACLGQTCQDVRIWTYREDFETDEAKQAGVSYLFSNGVELCYCIYLHGDLSSDYLLPVLDVGRQRVENVFSIGQGGQIDRRG